MNTESAHSPTNHMLALSAITLFVGAGGTAVSFLFLASTSHLDVISGAVGFVTGSILVAAGLLSLAVQSQLPAARQLATQIVMCLVGVLPPSVAILAWPLLYFGMFPLALLLTPIVLILCAAWAWGVSAIVADNLCAMLGSTWLCTTRIIVFVAQLIGIAASLPIFIWIIFNTLESMGCKVGWS